jgi:hypothetical protein
MKLWEGNNEVNLCAWVKKSKNKFDEMSGKWRREEIS